MIIENKQKFINWYKSHVCSDLVNNNSVYSERYISKWFDIVQSQHKSIRKSFDGLTKTLKLNITNLTYVWNPNNDIIIDDLYYFLPNMKNVMKRFNLTRDDLKNRYLEKLNNISTVKFLSNNINFNDSIYGNTRYYLNRYSNAMGTSCIDNGKYVVKILTCAKDFLSLGHFGIDDGVCFADDGCNWNHKYKIATGKDTFVALFYNTELDGKNLIGRCWGKWDENKWAFTNFYAKKGCNIVSLKLILSKIFDKELIETSIKSGSHAVYRNGDAVATDKHSYHLNIKSMNAVVKKKVII